MQILPSLSSSPAARRAARTAIVLAASLLGTALAEAQDATAILRSAFDNWRAKSSTATIEMVIHRPAWQRSMTMLSWTEGHNKSLARFTAPAKDAGNATLTIGGQTYVFNPKLNQVIKIPASTMAQSWMGSDFSYNDLSKSEDLLSEYTHKITSTARSGGHKIYVIEAIPKPGAPVVWGKIEARVRDDGVFVKETFFDQDLKPVRVMSADKIAALGGRAYPVVLTMRQSNKANQWTRITTTKAAFDVSQPSYLFTKSNLQNPRD